MRFSPCFIPAWKAGGICSGKQIPLPDVPDDTPGYYPVQVKLSKACEGIASLPYRLAPGQLALWEIICTQPNVELLPPTVPKEAREPFYVTLRPRGNLLETLLEYPTLERHFCGICIGADVLNHISTGQLKSVGSYLQRHGLSVMVDFTPLLNHYPDLSLISNMPQKHASHMSWFEELLVKAETLGAHTVFLTTHRNAENHITKTEALEEMKHTLEKMKAAALCHGLRTLLKNNVPTAVCSHPDQLRQAFPQWDLAGDAGHLFLEEKGVSSETVHQWQGVFLHHPLIDDFAQNTNAHLPLHEESSFAPQTKALLAQLRPDGGQFLCLDGVYENFEQIYQDCQWLKALHPLPYHQK